jgi:ATP-dependent DNA helicase RecQ
MNDLNLATTLRPRRKAQRRQSRRHYAIRLESLLHERFGLKRLRPGQRVVIDHVMQGQDTLAIMPTGAGKSLCFQLPALLMPNLTVVVSPLISLMQDQVGKLEEAGIQAEQVNSTLNADREEAALHNIEQSQTKIVYATPERMADAGFVASLQQTQVDLFVIDEAHCISQWGHDFRPAYLELANAVAALGCPPILALTATATAEVADDIRKQLGVRSMCVINTGIYRPNFHYSVIQITSDEEKHTETLRLVSETQGSGIIYMATVKAATALYEALKEAGESVALYHGRLSVAERRDNQECFMQGDCRIMVATNAFGMGIDKDDVRFIVHFQMPANLETYYQESGRAGRDGKQAACTLLFDRKDKRVQQFFLVKHYPDADELLAVHGTVAALNEEGRPATFSAVKRMLPNRHDGSVKASLQVLRQHGVLGQNRKLAFRAKRAVLATATLEKLAQEYAARQERDAEALEALVDYAQSGRCRWKLLLDYFDDDEPLEKCGQCDNCLHPPELLLAQKDAETEDGGAPEVHKLPDIAIGSAARVPRLGKGRITAVAGDQITLELANGDSRTFLRKYVKLLKQA